MPISINPQMMRAVIMDHYQNPQYKLTPKGKDYLSFHMDSENCIDDINVFVLLKDDIVEECFWDGVACTISTASTDIMCELVSGKSTKEARYILSQYSAMIHEMDFDQEALGDALAFINTSKQAARIKCATIGWNALEAILSRE